MALLFRVYDALILFLACCPDNRRLQAFVVEAIRRNVDGCRFKSTTLVHCRRTSTGETAMPRWEQRLHSRLVASRKRKRLIVAVLAEAGSKSALKALQDELQKGVRKPPLRAERRPTGTLLSPKAQPGAKRSPQNRKAGRTSP
jgi:hypothetical protein